MSPEPTGVTPKLERLEGIRAVVFDIYGTLLISDAGDVSSNSNERKRRAMSLVAERLGGEADASVLLEKYEGRILQHLSRERGTGVDHPEVEIREVWDEILRLRAMKSPTTEFIEEIALLYECTSNPVWPMPGARELLERLSLSGLKKGVVSNAQFYTPLVMEELFQKSLSDLGFSEDWVIFSYELRRGKPSPEIFREARARIVESGFSPDEILFVGNDMRKDIEPATSVGFKTCLFAGDARSLRLGRGSLDDARNRADVVVTELGQLTDVII